MCWQLILRLFVRALLGFFWRNLAEKKNHTFSTFTFAKVQCKFCGWNSVDKLRTQKNQSYSVLFSQKFEYEMTTAGIIQLPTCQGRHLPILKRSFNVLSFEFLTYFGFSGSSFPSVGWAVFTNFHENVLLFQGQNKNFLSFSILGHEKAKQSRPGGG